MCRRLLSARAQNHSKVTCCLNQYLKYQYLMWSHMILITMAVVVELLYNSYSCEKLTFKFFSFFRETLGVSVGSEVIFITIVCILSASDHVKIRTAFFIIVEQSDCTKDSAHLASCSSAVLLQLARKDKEFSL